MDYTKHYNNLIERAKNRTSTGFYENHHVVPKCLGGDDDNTNIVTLTPEEHYVAHQLLIKIYPSHTGLLWAAIKMTGDKHEHRSNNKLYGWLKRRCSEQAKQRVGSNNGSYGKGWFHDPQTLENGKYTPGSEPCGWVKGRKTKRLYRCCKMCNTEFELKDSRDGRLVCSNICWQQVRAQTSKPKRQQKSKQSFTTNEKLEALRQTNGNIRQALFLLGLNDSGGHYHQMRLLKASVYPLATNQ